MCIVGNKSYQKLYRSKISLSNKISSRWKGKLYSLNHKIDIKYKYNPSRCLSSLNLILRHKTFVIRSHVHCHNLYSVICLLCNGGLLCGGVDGNGSLMHIWHEIWARVINHWIVVHVLMIHHWLSFKCWVRLKWLCDSACTFSYWVFLCYWGILKFVRMIFS